MVFWTSADTVVKRNEAATSVAYIVAIKNYLAAVESQLIMSAPRKALFWVPYVSVQDANATSH